MADGTFTTLQITGGRDCGTATIPDVVVFGGMNVAKSVCVDGDLTVAGNLVAETKLNDSVLVKFNKVIPYLTYEIMYDIGPNQGDGSYLFKGTIMMQSGALYKVFDIIQIWDMVGTTFTLRSNVKTVLYSTAGCIDSYGVDTVVYDSGNDSFGLEWHADGCGATAINVVISALYTYNPVAPFV